MFSRRIQQRARHLVALLIRPLARLGVTPNTLTVIGLLIGILTAVVIAQGYLVAGGLLVLFAGIFDMFDGAMPRFLNGKLYKSPCRRSGIRVQNWFARSP